MGNNFKDDEIVGRFGGDEFIVFIKNNNDKKFACDLADKIAKGLSKTVLLPSKSKKVSTSIGIAIYNGEENTYSELFKKADIALYKAKADSKKRYFLYDV